MNTEAILTRVHKILDRIENRIGSAKHVPTHTAADLLDEARADVNRVRKELEAFKESDDV